MCSWEEVSSGSFYSAILAVLDDEHIFMYLLAFGSSAHIFFFFFGQNLFLWNFISSLCILDINPLLVLLFANVFSYSVQCLFILLLGSFAMQKLFGLMFISAFVAFTFGVNAKKSSSRPVLRNLLYFNITILGAMFKFLRYVIIVCNE